MNVFARRPPPVLAALLLVVMTAPLLVGRRPAEAQTGPVSREVLALYDGSEAPPNSEFVPARTSLVHTLAETPLNFLGLKVHYRDVNTAGLPSDNEMQRYLGVITWFQDDRLRDAVNYLRWVRQQMRAGKRVVILGSLGAGTDNVTHALVPDEELLATYAAMGLRFNSLHIDNPTLMTVRRKVPEMVEFERTLDGELSTHVGLTSTAATNRVYLTINRSDLLGGDSDVVVTGPWGGFALEGYVYYLQPRTFQKRWRLNPFAFFEEAFGIKGYPRPDVSTLNGSRVFYTHVDGDGFNNISETDYSSLSAELLLRRFLRRYDLPFTISIVVNDIDPARLGGDRQLRVAREIFERPNVELATHTYTHPFDWSKPVDLDREIDASLAFLNARVATPDRPVRILLWSGATNPSEEAITRTDKLGVININGGDPRFDPASDSYAGLAPLTTQVGEAIQFYTSNANDNIYGNDWTGPYYGLRNVIATWERTESPRRIGAINVYYHIFTAEKHASVKALEEVYDYVVERDIAPMFTADYLKTVQGFLSAEIAREGQNAWRIRNHGALRTIRFDGENRFPDLGRSQNVIGYQRYQGSLYVFLGEAPESMIALTESAPSQPYISLASHRILDWRLEQNGISLAVEGVGRKKVVLANVRPNAEFAAVETTAAGERRVRLRSDGSGTLTWTSGGPGRTRIAIPDAGAARRTPSWDTARRPFAWISGR